MIRPARVVTLSCAVRFGRFVGVAASLATLAALPGVSPPALAGPDARAKPAVGASNDARAQEMIESAIRYEHAEGQPRDYGRAHALYCEAARLDSGDALVRMGWMYANGRGVPRDDAMAHTLFKRAADLGSEMGTRLAGMIRAAPGAAGKAPACLVARKPAGNAADLAALARGGFLSGVSGEGLSLAAWSSRAPRWLLDTVLPLAREYSVDPRLVLAVMRAESNFNPSARSQKNAQGLMQLIPETAERFAVSDILDPAQNVRGGIRYLRWLLSYFRGNVLLSLAAYNAGEGTVNRYRGVPPYPETMAYVARIMALYPHHRHPYDERVTDPSPLIGSASGGNLPAAASNAAIADASPVIGDERPGASRVTYFLAPEALPMAKSRR